MRNKFLMCFLSVLTFTSCDRDPPQTIRFSDGSIHKCYVYSQSYGIKLECEDITVYAATNFQIIK